WQVEPELLRGLAQPRRVRVLAGLELPLEQGPRPGILAGPERTAHVPEQHLEPAVGSPPVEQQPRARRRHGPSLARLARARDRRPEPLSHRRQFRALTINIPFTLQCPARLLNV